MNRTLYVVRTANGYVGRDSVAGPLTDTMPPAWAYVFDTRVSANMIAAAFDGGVVVPLDGTSLPGGRPRPTTAAR